MKRLLLVLLFLAAALAMARPARAQKNECAVFAVGDFNGGSFIHLNSQGGTPVAVTYRSAMGGAAACRRWLTPRVAAGVWWEANPSGGELFTSSADPYRYDIALTRAEVVLPVTLRLWTGRRVEPFLEAGPGWIVTHGAQPGWSENFAIATGAGVDWWLRPGWAVEVGERALNARQGCYGDPTCAAAWAVAQSVRAGVVLRR